MQDKPKLIDLIKDNTVKFHSLRSLIASYTVTYDGNTYLFEVPLDDVGNGVLLAEDKAIMFMRWIRKALDKNELYKIN